MSKSEKYPDLDYHLQLLLDGELGPEDLARLEKAILEDPEVRDYCVDYFVTAAAVRRSSQETGDMSRADLLTALRQEPTREMTRPWWARSGMRALAAALILVVSLFWIVTRHNEPKPGGPVVGRLMDQSQALWESPRRGIRTGVEMHAGAFQLREGLARIALTQGAEVILQAPCVFSLDGANELTLVRGKLAATVAAPARGFVVHTKSAVVTDLGTEFGVMADPQGGVEVHVFVGRVMLTPGPETPNQAGDMPLDAGQAAVVAPSGRAIRTAYRAQAGLFVRTMPKPGERSSPGRRLNLADVVGGGNGFGAGVPGDGIDLLTGRPFRRPIRVVRRAERAGYTPVSDRRYIDGVFVPNAQFGKVVISSTRLIFQECPTTLGTYYEGVVNTAEQTVVDQPDATYPGRLRGVEYGTPEHPALNIHPNAGITFDLEAIRADNPGTCIEQFTAVCGVSASVPRARRSLAEIWVLVDGKVSFHVPFPADQNGSREIAVPIPAEARFLTLVTTCTGDAGHSWCFFGDPMLEMAAETLDN
jgi:hypothetical protein